MTFLYAFACFLVGLFALSLIEYVHHWHGGHRGWLGKKLLESHLAHHRDPLEGGVTYAQKVRQRMPLVVFSVFLIGTPLWLLTSIVTATWVMTGIVAGYFYSEWFHHSIHHRAPRNAFERYMWHYHYIHHFRVASTNIGFTSPIWDFVFGTSRWDESLVVPAARVKTFVAAMDGVSIQTPRTENAASVTLASRV